MATLSENNQITATVTIVSKSIGKKIAIASGILSFRKMRNAGISNKLKKNAMIIGMITMLPFATISTIRHRPNNSIDLLTVNGNSFIALTF